MAIEVLYRKARPMTFDEMRGQEVVVRSLRNQIIRDRISHAYLFTGIRGTGKTSAARIFARAVNCEHPQNGNPCNECPSCRAMIGGSSDNLIEIDAAANGLISDIRDITELAGHRPMHGKYRVFIIDETQEMKPGAVNAFLKTLEEPPSWVIFILATTSLRNMPETIMSRCQEYHFRRLDDETIADQMRRVLEKEGVEAGAAAISQIASLSEGSMRDALSLLDRAVSYAAGEVLTSELVREALGLSDSSRFSTLFRAAVRGDTGTCLRIFREMYGNGTDPESFVLGFLSYLKDILLAKSVREREDAAGQEALQEREESGGPDSLPAEEDAALLEEEQLLDYIRIFSNAENRIRTEESKRLPAEMALILASEAGKGRKALLEKRIAELEARTAGMP